MLPTLVYTLLAFAPAPPAPGTQANPTAALVQQILLIGFMCVVLYFLMIRGPRNRAKQQEELLKGLKSGDKIETAGGIVGVVITVKETTVSIRSADAKLEILKTAVSKISERAGQQQAAQTT